MPTVPGFELDLGGLEGYPVAIGHGTHDQVIGVEWGRQARDRLEAAGADVTYRESPIGHSVDPRFVQELSVWLGGVV
jgi:predicted esterase